MYAYPQLSSKDFIYFRFLGEGLGNLLFPWARAVSAARQFQLTPVWPAWTQIKIGPILRREPDKRFYHDLFTCPRGYVNGLTKLGILLSNPHLPETALDKGVGTRAENAVIRFSGMNGFFQRFLDDYAFVGQELVRMTRDEHKRGLEFDFTRSISVHIRLGDFSVPSSADHLRSDTYRLPIAWYVSAIAKLRAELGAGHDVYVFSDGTNTELSEVLQLKNTHRLDFGSSIADLLALSRANILVASGSTFSMWASYVGRMPVLWYPGRLRQPLYFDNPAGEIEFHPDTDLGQSFLALTAKPLTLNR